MNISDEKLQELIAEYLNAEISDEKRKDLELLAEKQGVPLTEFVRMHKQLEGFKVPVTSQALDEKFYAMLNEKKLVRQTKSDRWMELKQMLLNAITVPQVPRLAYGFILLLLGLLIGNMLMPNRGHEKQIGAITQEMGDMRQLMVLSMIEGEHATDRIKAVSYVDEMDELDNKIIEALFKTLNNDKNINVRLSSLEALVKFAHLPAVRERLVKAIAHQQSAIVLMELADLMIQLQEKKSIKELQKLLKKDDLEPNLRLTIENGIQTLT